MDNSCAAHYTSLLETTRMLQRPRYLGRCGIRERATHTENIVSAIGRCTRNHHRREYQRQLRLSPVHLVLSFIGRSVSGVLCGIERMCAYDL